MGNFALLYKRSLMGWFTDFVGALTGDSGSKVSHAHHDALDHSGVREGNDKSNFDKAPDWADKTTDSGTPLFPDGK